MRPQQRLQQRYSPSISPTDQYQDPTLNRTSISNSILVSRGQLPRSKSAGGGSAGAGWSDRSSGAAAGLVIRGGRAGCSITALLGLLAGVGTGSALALVDLACAFHARSAGAAISLALSIGCLLGALARGHLLLNSLHCGLVE